MCNARLLVGGKAFLGYGYVIVARLKEGNRVITRAAGLRLLRHLGSFVDHGHVGPRNHRAAAVGHAPGDRSGFDLAKANSARQYPQNYRKGYRCEDSSEHGIPPLPVRAYLNFQFENCRGP